MNEHERRAARNALIQWFDSQGIMPGDAGIICFELIAEQLVLKTRNLQELQEAINIQMQFLAIQVAQELRSHA